MANEDHSMTPGEYHARIRFTKRLLRFVRVDVLKDVRTEDDVERPDVADIRD